MKREITSNLTSILTPFIFSLFKLFKFNLAWISELAHCVPTAGAWRLVIFCYTSLFLWFLDEITVCQLFCLWIRRGMPHEGQNLPASRGYWLYTEVERGNFRWGTKATTTFRTVVAFFWNLYLGYLGLIFSKEAATNVLNCCATVSSVWYQWNCFTGRNLT